MRFSAEQAFEASDEGEPIMLDHGAALAIIRQHDTGHASDAEAWGEFVADMPAVVHLDAANLLAWLGY